LPKPSISLIYAVYRDNSESVTSTLIQTYTWFGQKVGEDQIIDCSNGSAIRLLLNEGSTLFFIEFCTYPPSKLLSNVLKLSKLIK